MNSACTEHALSMHSACDQARARSGSQEGPEEVISMQSACTQHALSMQTACKQHAISRALKRDLRR